MGIAELLSSVPKVLMQLHI